VNNRPPPLGRILAVIFIVLTIGVFLGSDEEAFGERLAGAMCGAVLLIAVVLWGLAVVVGEWGRLQRVRRRGQRRGGRR
jgi:hypothetical protein